MYLVIISWQSKAIVWNTWRYFRDKKHAGIKNKMAVLKKKPETELFSNQGKELSVCHAPMPQGLHNTLDNFPFSLAVYACILVRGKSTLATSGVLCGKPSANYI